MKRNQKQVLFLREQLTSSKKYIFSTNCEPIHLILEIKDFAFNFRFTELQRQATLAVTLVPYFCTKKGWRKNASDLEYYLDDVPEPASLDQELHSWKVRKL